MKIDATKQTANKRHVGTFIRVKGGVWEQLGTDPAEGHPALDELASHAVDVKLAMFPHGLGLAGQTAMPSLLGTIGNCTVAISIESVPWYQPWRKPKLLVRAEFDDVEKRPRKRRPRHAPPPTDLVPA